MPRTVWPNLRDHGKTCERDLLRILQNLQRAHGWAYFAEAGMQKMLCEDMDHMPGVGTVAKALERLAAQGIIHQVWLLKGGLLPDGDDVKAGMRMVRVAMSREEGRGFLARWRTQSRRPAGQRRETTLGGRVNHRAVFELMTVRREVPKPPPDTSRADFTRRAAEQLEALEAWARDVDEASTPPPG